MSKGDSISHFGAAPDSSHGASLPTKQKTLDSAFKKPRPKRSWLWEHFKIQEKNPYLVNCNHCGKEQVRSQGNSNMHRHLKHCKLVGKQTELSYQASADGSYVVSGSTWQDNDKEMHIEKKGRKREPLAETDGVGKNKSWPNKAASQAVSYYQLAMESPSKLAEVLRLKRVVARKNKENPGEEPIVVEELSSLKRAELLQEEKAREMSAQRELSNQMYAQLQLAETKMPRAPPPPLADPKQKDEQDYSEYRRSWNNKWSSQYGSFEDSTPIPCMRFTDNPMPHLTCHPSTMEIFSVNVAEISSSLQWPLNVFGTIAMRDGLDHNRNIIFSRTRDNCQILTQQDRNLVLTGPVRGVVHKHGSVYIDAVLKVKGGAESEDKDLSLLIRRCNCNEALTSFVSSRKYISKLSTLELAYGIIVSSVEATITIRVLKGSWPDGYRGQFKARTGSLPDMEVLLLDSSDEKVVDADGMVELSRRVVSVERHGNLIVSAVLFRGGHRVVDSVTFSSCDTGRSPRELDVGFCKMRVTVAWSPFLKGYPSHGFSPAKV